MSKARRWKDNILLSVCYSNNIWCFTLKGWLVYSDRFPWAARIDRMRLSLCSKKAGEAGPWNLWAACQMQPTKELFVSRSSQERWSPWRLMSWRRPEPVEHLMNQTSFYFTAVNWYSVQDGCLAFKFQNVNQQLFAQSATTKHASESSSCGGQASQIMMKNLFLLSQLPPKLAPGRKPIFFI